MRPSGAYEPTDDIVLVAKLANADRLQNAIQMLK